ncbi:NUDIX domain-containing protein [Actinomadura flavalba]|uniref:NUDIX domain-containing protein n=1 Tax=Actinomadura flavalba TaxID=1120938 RepID=UPI00035F345D|nr:NUDIX hydrolase [Actinomadura flavalba]
MTAPENREPRDAAEQWEVASTERLFDGVIFNVRRDHVVMPDGEGGTEAVRRDIVEHRGSVGVLVLDERGRVLLLWQYRHAVGARLWEIPAGLRDVEGEPLRALAERELLEEAGYRAARWDTLVDVYPTPGMAEERSRVFLARDLTRVPDAEIDFVRRHEEADMTSAWVPLEDAVRAVLAGRLHNALTVQGILAAHAHLCGAVPVLRPADAPEE